MTHRDEWGCFSGFSLALSRARNPRDADRQPDGGSSSSAGRRMARAARQLTAPRPAALEGRRALRGRAHARRGPGPLLLLVADAVAPAAARRGPRSLRVPPRRRCRRSRRLPTSGRPRRSVLDLRPLGRATRRPVGFRSSRFTSCRPRRRVRTSSTAPIAGMTRSDSRASVLTVRALLRRLAARAAAEVGLHGSYLSHLDGGGTRPPAAPDRGGARRAGARSAPALPALRRRTTWRAQQRGRLRVRRHARVQRGARIPGRDRGAVRSVGRPERTRRSSCSSCRSPRWTVCCSARSSSTTSSRPGA